MLKIFFTVMINFFLLLNSVQGQYAMAELESDVSLPVSLIAFDVSPQESKILLEWTVASEFNTIGYALEFSEYEDHNFQLLADYTHYPELQSNGNSSQARTYVFYDNSIKFDIIFYRLYSIDFDGTRELLSEKSVQSVLSGANSLYNLNIYPNPFNSISYIEFDLSEPGPVFVSIFNVKGMLIKTINQNFNSATNVKIPLIFDEISSGVYFISINIKNKTFRKKIFYLK